MQFFRSGLITAGIILSGVGAVPIPIRATSSISTLAVLSLSPASGEVAAGKMLEIDLIVDSPLVAVGGVQSVLGYSDNLVYVSSTGDGSVFANEVTPPKSENGTLSLSRVRLDKGFLGSHGKVIHLFFASKQGGVATVWIDQARSQVVSYADSRNVLGSVQNGTYALRGVSVTSTPTSATTPSDRVIWPLVTGVTVLGVFFGIFPFFTHRITRKKGTTVQ